MRCGHSTAIVCPWNRWCSNHELSKTHFSHFVVSWIKANGQDLDKNLILRKAFGGWSWNIALKSQILDHSPSGGRVLPCLHERHGDEGQIETISFGKR